MREREAGEFAIDGEELARGDGGLDARQELFEIAVRDFHRHSPRTLFNLLSSFGSGLLKKMAIATRRTECEREERAAFGTERNGRNKDESCLLHIFHPIFIRYGLQI